MELVCGLADTYYWLLLQCYIILLDTQIARYLNLKGFFILCMSIEYIILTHCKILFILMYLTE